MKKCLLIFLSCAPQIVLMQGAQKTLSPFLQSRVSHLIERLDTITSLDQDLKLEAQDLILELQQSNSQQEIERIKKRLTNFGVTEEAESNPEAPLERAQDLHKKLKAIKEKQEKKPKELAEHLMNTIEDLYQYWDETDDELKRVQEILDQGVNYHIRVRGETPWSRVHNLAGIGLNKVRKLFLKEEAKREKEEQDRKDAYVAELQCAKDASQIANLTMEEVSAGSTGHGEISNIIEEYLKPEPLAISKTIKVPKKTACVIS